MPLQFLYLADCMALAAITRCLMALLGSPGAAFYMA